MIPQIRCEPAAGHAHLGACGHEFREYAVACLEAWAVDRPCPACETAAIVNPCAQCRGTGRRGHPDVTLGATIACPGCDATGICGEGYATAAELAALGDAAVTYGLDAAGLTLLSEALFGESPRRLRERHVRGLLRAIAGLVAEATS